MYLIWCTLRDVRQQEVEGRRWTILFKNCTWCHTLTTELLFYLVLSPAGWIGTSYYILSGFYVCAMYTSLQSLPEKLYQFVDLEKKKKKEKSVIVCKLLFFSLFCWHLLGVFCQHLWWPYVLLQPNASLLQPTFNENQSSNRVVECKKTVPCFFSTGDLWKTQTELLV